MRNACSASATSSVGQRTVRGGDRLVPLGGGLDQGGVQSVRSPGSRTSIASKVSRRSPSSRDRRRHADRHRGHRPRDRDDEPGRSAAVRRPGPTTRCVVGRRHVAGGQAGQHDADPRAVQQPGQLGQHDRSRQSVMSQRPTLGAKQQLARLDRVLRLDVGPAQFGEPRHRSPRARRHPCPRVSSNRRKTASSIIGHDSSAVAFIASPWEAPEGDRR